MASQEFQALLDWRNTPIEGVGTSPAQRLMGTRCCKTLLPTTDTLLKPQYDVDTNTQAIRRKEDSRRRYNQGARPLIPLKSGDVVRMKLPGQQIWTPAVVTGEVTPRSYEVKVNGTIYRRNRRDLLLEQLPSGDSSFADSSVDGDVDDLFPDDIAENQAALVWIMQHLRPLTVNPHPLHRDIRLVFDGRLNV